MRLVIIGGMGTPLLPVRSILACAILSVAVFADAPVAIIKAYSHRGASSASSGSCTLIAKDDTQAYWITADHVTRSAPYLEVLLRSGGRWAGRTVVRDSGADLAVLRTSSTNIDLQPILVWPRQQLGSEWYYAEGFAGASFQGFGRRKGKLGNLMGNMVRWLLPSIPGDSGGCIYLINNGQRYQCGVTSGSDWPSYRSYASDGYTVGGSPSSLHRIIQAAGLTIEPTGLIRCPGRTLGGRNWPDPIQELPPDT